MQAIHALKGQKLLAQGIALVGIMAISKAPCKGVWSLHEKLGYI